MEKLRLLQGMQDLRELSWQPLMAAQERLKGTFASYGYRPIETPILEPTELFLRKSGGELASRMYSFTDPGGNRVSLRPEYTSSIMRHFLEGGFSEPMPVRVQYAGPVFRYEGEGTALRQFTQVGAELIGSSSPKADAEVLSLSCAAMSDLGLKEYRLHIGDLSVYYGVLNSLGLSERSVLFILNSLSDLKKGPEGLDRVRERAAQLKLLTTDTHQSHLVESLGSMDDTEARGLLQGLLQRAELGPMGQRDPEEIVERLLRKSRGADDPAKLLKGMDVAAKLTGVSGEPGAALAEAESIVNSFKLDESVLKRLNEIIELLGGLKGFGATVVLDFGLARGLAYYTGIVFEILRPGQEVSLGGGGRYDGLARALGSESNIPALGFAFTLENLPSINRSKRVGKSRLNEADLVLVLPSNGRAYDKALHVAGQLRNRGTQVEMDLSDMLSVLSIDECLSYAKAKGIAQVMAVDGGGKSTTYQVNSRDSDGRG